MLPQRVIKQSATLREDISKLRMSDSELWLLTLTFDGTELWRLQS